MRNIKFRAWDKVNKKMYEVNSIHFGVQHGMARGDLVDYVELDGKSSVYIVGDEVELMQFTGLKDRMGSEIYEGDIVRAIVEKYTNDQQVIHRVSWNDKYAAFEPFCHKMNYGEDVWIDIAKDIEIIGNIYEHPELLQRKPTP